MNASSSPIFNDYIKATFVPIVIRTDRYNISWQEFSRSELANDKQLQSLSDEVLKIFRAFERQVNKQKKLDIDPIFCQEHLAELARFGRRAYQRLFHETEAQEALVTSLQGDGVPAPTFISPVIPFPWEVLYEGEDYKAGNPKLFWGARYAVARMLEEKKPLPKYVLQQAVRSNMLFCLHHKLYHAHQQEHPLIEKMVKRLSQEDEFHLLNNHFQLGNGEEFLKYLDNCQHNMLHFACHCRPCEAGADALSVSLLDENDETNSNVRVIELETGNFEDVKGKFDGQPLVFLNACQSSGGPDDLRKTYNLPLVFAKRGAGAIIATACPVPDLFAAAFARVFYQYFFRSKKVVDKVTGQKIRRSVTIGEALRATRRYFIRCHHNPLGLAYGLYTPAYYQLGQAPVTQGGHVWLKQKH